LRELGIEIRPRQASVIECVVLLGTSEGLVGLRVLEGAHCRCCSTKWSCEIISVKILYSVEGGCWNLFWW